MYHLALSDLHYSQLSASLRLELALASGRENFHSCIFCIEKGWLRTLNAAHALRP